MSSIGEGSPDVVIPETAAKRRLSGTHSEHRQARSGPDARSAPL